MATEALETIGDDTEQAIDLGGRPTLYRQEFNRQARNLALLGATDEEFAAFFQVSVSTIEAWKRTKPKFQRAIQSGKIKADANVAKRLYNRASGYSHPETKVMVVDGSIQEVEITKHYPPDTAAAKLWLTNRRPDLWRDRSNVDVTSNGQSISSLAAAAWAYGEQLRAQQISSIEGTDAQKLLSEPREP